MDKGEFFAIKEDDLKDGEKKEITIGETKILLVKTEGKIYAVGALCPHYKAPLVKGALCGTKLYCPWHHSAFDIRDGSLCEPPAIEGLPTYQVTAKEDGIYITLPAKKALPERKIMYGSDQTFVILGGGAAGMMAAQTLRQQGFDGKLTMITKEPDLPYDRTALSKNFLSGKKKEEDLPLRKKEFFENNNITVLTDKRVNKVDIGKKQLIFSGSTPLSFDSLLLATGSQPVKLTIEGAGKANVFTLRSEEDAKKILEEAKQAKKVCIIGASFIALETAASLTTLGLQVTLIAKEKLPFEKNFGTEIGQMFYDIHTAKGVIIKTESEAEKIEGNDKAEVVVLKRGERIETDMVITGIGVKPVTDYLEGIVVNEKDNGILVNEYLEVSNDVFAVGDIAKYKDANTKEPVRIEHWRVAQQHGRIAAMNMINKKQHSIKEIVPFFWTNQFDNRLSYIGHAEDWDEVVTEGDIASQEFLSFYLKENKVLAVASMNRDMDSNFIEEIMLLEGSLPIQELRKKLKSKK